MTSGRDADQRASDERELDPREAGERELDEREADEREADERFVVTADGSLTLFNEEAGELYHNSAGAFTEALKSYVEPSTAVDVLRKNGSLHVLDACFGLGYNSFVLVQHLVESGAQGKVLIKAIENDPAIVAAAWSQAIADERLPAARACLEASRSGVPSPQLEGQSPQLEGQSPQLEGRSSQLEGRSPQLERQSPQLDVILDVVLGDLRQELPKVVGDFDLVFHDPFSPRKVPELWTVDIFRQYHARLSNRRGRLLTYSIAGAVRGGLIEAGFQVWRTTAVGGKYGGTLALFAGTDPPDGCSPGAQGVGDRRGGPASLVPFRDETFVQPREDILRRRAAEQATYKQ